MLKLTAAVLVLGLMTQSACARPSQDEAQESRSRDAISVVAQGSDSRMGEALRQNMAVAQACPRDMNLAINAAIAATLGAVRGNNSKALLNLISPQGVTIGQGRQLSYAVVSSQFAAKTGVYCDLFACKGKTGTLHGLFVAGPTDTSVDTRNGLASVFINANTDKELDLSFRWINCGWYVTAMGGA